MLTQKSSYRINPHFMPENYPWKKKQLAFNSSKEKIQQLRSSLINMQKMIMRSREVLKSSKQKIKIKSKSKSKVVPSDKLNIKLNTEVQPFHLHNRTISNISNIYSIQTTPKTYKNYDEKELRHLNYSTELPKTQKQREHSILREQSKQSLQSSNAQQLNNRNIKQNLFNVKEKEKQQFRLKQRNQQIFIDDEDYYQTRIQPNSSYKILSEKHNYPDQEISNEPQLTYYQQHQLKKKLQKDKAKIQLSQTFEKKSSQYGPCCCYCGEKLPLCYNIDSSHKCSEQSSQIKDPKIIKLKKRNHNFMSQFQQKSFMSPKNQSSFLSYKDEKNIFHATNNFSSPQYSQIHKRKKQDYPYQLDFGRIQHTNFESSPLNRKSNLVNTTYSFSQKTHEGSPERKKQCQHCNKYEKQNQRDRFVKKVKKYGFVEKYLTIQQIYGIYQKLKDSVIPEHRWPLVVIDEVYERMQQHQKYKIQL